MKKQIRKSDIANIYVGTNTKEIKVLPNVEEFEDNNDKLNVYKFVCSKCDWGKTATLYYMRNSYACPSCGGKLEYGLLIDDFQKHEKVYYKPYINEKAKIKEKANVKATKEILNVSKEVKETPKNYIKICENKNCGAFNVVKFLEHSTDGKASGDIFCRFCGMQNRIVEDKR